MKTIEFQQIAERAKVRLIQSCKRTLSTLASSSYTRLSCTDIPRHLQYNRIGRGIVSYRIDADCGMDG